MWHQCIFYRLLINPSLCKIGHVSLTYLKINNHVQPGTSLHSTHTQEITQLPTSFGDKLPQNWAFVVYSSYRDYAFFGITDDYNEALIEVNSMEDFEHKIHVILLDPNHPIIFWGYGEFKPTYITLAIIDGGNNQPTELIPEYDWSRYHAVDLDLISVFFFESEGQMPFFVDSVDENTYTCHILFGKDEHDAIESAKEFLSKISLVNVTDYDCCLIDDLSLFVQTEGRRFWPVPYEW